MEKTTHVYSKVLPVFKRRAAQLIAQNLPGHVKASKAALNQFLQKKGSGLHRWYIALVAGILTAAEFSRLFTAIKTTFSLKKLNRRGVAPDKIHEMVMLITSLLKEILITMSGASIADKAIPQNGKQNKN
ncbi:MAG: hypothetical protein ACYCZO_07740 [Daejeonella sp.]